MTTLVYEDVWNSEIAVGTVYAVKSVIMKYI